MYFDEAGNDRRIFLADTLRELSGNPDPVASINTFSRAIRMLYGNQGIISVSLRNMAPGHYRVMRILHQEGVVAEGYKTVEFAGHDAPAHTGGIVGEIVRREQPVVIRDLDITHDPVLGNNLAPYRVLVAIPVYNQGELLNWVLFISTDAESITNEDVENRIIQSNLMGEVNNNKRITHELREAMHWIHQEIDEIAQLQRAMLPATMPPILGLELAVMYETYDRAGGDYYDIFPVNVPVGQAVAEDHPDWAMFIADASGHGPSAAVVIAVLSTLLRTSCSAVNSPSSVLDYLNSYLASRQFRHSFVTAFLAFLDAKTGRFRYACAGHQFPIVRTPGGDTLQLNSIHGLPLGVQIGAPYEEAESSLDQGHSMMLYTDGITEAKSPDGTLFGEENLLAHLRSVNGSPADMIDALLRVLRTHEAGKRPNDDQTVVMIRRH
jgi:serine phosphatase RsbU (regulator of sigma subunit)